MRAKCLSQNHLSVCGVYVAHVCVLRVPMNALLHALCGGVNVRCLHLLFYVGLSLNRELADSARLAGWLVNPGILCLHPLSTEVTCMQH